MKLPLFISGKLGTSKIDVGTKFGRSHVGLNSLKREIGYDS